jgi:hypothetical protein
MIKRFSASILVLLLSACGGGQNTSIPSAAERSAPSSTSGAPSMQSVAAKGTSFGISPETSTCQISGYYEFEGACTSAVLSAAGTTFKLKSYRNIRATFRIPKNNGDGNYTFTYADATGEGDIGEWNGQAFPLYPNPCAVSSCPGTAFFYVGVEIAGPSSQLNVHGDNVFTFENKGAYPGTTCGEALLSSGEWYPFGPSSSPVGDKLTFKYADDYVAGVYTVATYCT